LTDKFEKKLRRKINENGRMESFFNGSGSGVLLKKLLFSKVSNKVMEYIVLIYYNITKYLYIWQYCQQYNGIKIIFSIDKVNYS